MKQWYKLYLDLFVVDPFHCLSWCKVYCLILIKKIIKTMLMYENSQRSGLGLSSHIVVTTSGQGVVVLVSFISIVTKYSASINTLRPRQNGRHFTGGVFKCIFLKENVWILHNISLKFAPKVQINNIPALVQIMAWCRSGNKPLSEPMMVSLLTHICVSRAQWVNSLVPRRCLYFKSECHRTPLMISQHWFRWWFWCSQAPSH